MSDFLLDNAYARTLVRSLGLPLPTPEPLDRATGPCEERPLEGRSVWLGAAPNAGLAAAIARAVVAAGAEPVVEGSGHLASALEDVAEAYGRLPRGSAEAGAVLGLVFDASGVESVAGLRPLFEFFHGAIERLDRRGRVVVLGRPVESARRAEEAAARRALEGFVRSVAKEIGRRGATANLILVEEGAESRVEGVLRFLLSRRSSFVSAQPFRVTAAAHAPARPAGWVRSLDKKVALVTGAARGIGAATAARLAAEGAHVVCLDRPADAAPLARVAQSIGGSTLPADVTDAGAPQAIAGVLRGRHGGVDIVVHNAGITRDKTLARMDSALWDTVLDVSLGAAMRITAALEDGVLRDEGRIVCLSSIAGIAGNVGQSNYSAAKAGLIGFVRHRAAALAARGITVNAVAPGFIETRMTAAVPFFVREVGRRLAALGQGGLPADVAEGITFLATPAAAGLTGSIVRICGGAFLGA